MSVSLCVVIAHYNYFRSCGLSEGEGVPLTNPVRALPSTLPAPGLCPLAYPTKGDPFETPEDRKTKWRFAMAATGMNIEKCNVYKAEKHNGRDNKYIAAVKASPNKTYDIFEDRTAINKTWIGEDYQGKSLVQLLNEIRKEVKEKTGRTLQEKDRIRKVKDKKTGEFIEKVIAGSSPIREGVCPILEDTTIEDFKPVIDWFAERHVKVIRIDLHFDEGHVDAETNERMYNRHAHMIFDWMLHEDVEYADPKTKEIKIQKAGTSVKLNDKDMSELQTILAEALGMERGKSKEETNAEHLKALEYRLKKTAEELDKLKKKNEVLKEQNAELVAQNSDTVEIIRQSCKDLQMFGQETVKSFDEICQGGAAKPTEKEKTNRDLLEKESSDDVSLLEKDELRKKSSSLRSLIASTHKAIERIGNKLQKLAAKIPDTKFHLFSSSSQKAQILAIEAEKESEIGNIRAEAEKAVKEAEKAKNEALRQANAMETEAKKRSTAALNREQAARETEKKYSDLNANLEQQITEAKEAAQKESIHIQHQKWLKWKKDTHDPIVAERDSLKTKISELNTKLADKDK